MSTGFAVGYREYQLREPRQQPRYQYRELRRERADEQGPLVYVYDERVRERYLGERKVGEEVIASSLREIRSSEIFWSFPLDPRDIEVFHARKPAILKGSGLEEVGREEGWILASLPVYVGVDGKQSQLPIRLRANSLDGELQLRIGSTLSQPFNRVVGEMVGSALLVSLCAQEHPELPVPGQWFAFFRPSNPFGFAFGDVSGDVLFDLGDSPVCGIVREKLQRAWGHAVKVYNQEETQNRLGWPRSQLRFEPGKNLNRGLSFTEEGLAVMPILTKS